MAILNNQRVSPNFYDYLPHPVPLYPIYPQHGPFTRWKNHQFEELSKEV